MTKRSIIANLLIAVGFLLPTAPAFGAHPNPCVCEVCTKYISENLYIIDDQVSHTKRRICEQCKLQLPACFICGVPALKSAGAVQLDDGRALCGRDAKAVVFQEDEGLQLCGEVKDQLERQFSRFLSLPDDKITFAAVDRSQLQNLAAGGAAYGYPRGHGVTITKTNEGRLEYEINIVKGLPRSDFRIVCAHECAHAWLSENLSATRSKTLSQPAQEAFCDLLAYLCVDALQDETAKKRITGDPGTAGQIGLFLEAERLYGINEIVDWVKYGADDRLMANQLPRIRTLEAPGLSAPFAQFGAVRWAPLPARTYDNLALKGIIWDERRPVALLNDRALAPGLEVALRIRGADVVVRCLEIRKDFVRVQLVATGEDVVLKFGQPRSLDQPPARTT